MTKDLHDVTVSDVHRMLDEAEESDNLEARREIIGQAIRGYNRTKISQAIERDRKTKQRRRARAKAARQARKQRRR